MKILEEYDPQFNEGLQKYIGKPLKELLKDIDGRLRVNIEIANGVDFYGASGGSMLVNQIGWYLADAEIKYVVAPKDTIFHDIELALVV